jgi:alkylhydroperoxidase family enzyme
VDLADRLAGTDALAALDDAYAAAWAATEEPLLATCRDRVAMLLRHRRTLDAMSAERRDRLSRWTTSDLSDRERAALDFTEQYIVDVTAVTDEQTARLREHLGDEGLVNFVNALLVVEQRMTLELALDEALGTDRG